MDRRNALKTLGLATVGAAVGAAVAAHFTDADATIGLLGGVPASGSQPGFLPAGHWVAAVSTMSVIYPRPDTETSSFARHRWAYYDGTHSVQYRIPIGVRGGAAPYVFKLLQGPAGMSIESEYWVPGDTAAQMLSAGYGDVIWTPSASVTGATVQVQVTGQDGASVTVEWTVSTSSSTSQFVFVDPVNGVDANTGTILAPIKTFTKLLSGFAGATAYLRTGTHAAVSSMTLSSSTPAALINFPGESPIIDITGSSSTYCFGFTGNEIDNFFQGFSFTGTATANTAQYEYFWPGQQAFRWTQHLISFPSVFAGLNAANNSTGTYFSDFGASAGQFSQYIYCKGCSETNRVTASGQSYGLMAMYCTQYGLAEFNSVTNSSAVQNLYLKASNRNWTRRYNNLQMTNSSSALASGDQINTAGESQDDEVCYNLLVNAWTGTPTLLFNENQQSNAITTGYSYRNTIVGTGGAGGDITNGPFSFNYDAIQYGSAPQAILFYTTGWVGGTLPSNMTDSNTQCQASSGVLDGSYNLTGSYKTSWYGQRGWEIA